MHMTTPASTQFHYGACNSVSSVKLRHFNCFVPFRQCNIKPRCRFASRHLSPSCQAQAASVTEQSAPSSPTKRPRSPGMKGRKKASDIADDAADTGEAGKRVVIVGGGWAGKSRQLWTVLCSLPASSRLAPQADLACTLYACRFWCSKALVFTRLLSDIARWSTKSRWALSWLANSTRPSC